MEQSAFTAEIKIPIWTDPSVRMFCDFRSKVLDHPPPFNLV